MEMDGVETIKTAARERTNRFSNILRGVFIEGMFVEIGMISIFDGAGGCLHCRLSSTPEAMSHYMSSDATHRRAAGTSLTDKWR